MALLQLAVLMLKVGSLPVGGGGTKLEVFWGGGGSGAGPMGPETMDLGVLGAGAHPIRGPMDSRPD